MFLFFICFIFFVFFDMFLVFFDMILVFFEVLKLLLKSLQDLFKAFEDEETMKKAMVRNMWTVYRPMLSKKKFEKVSNQAWAEGLKQGTHRLKQSWVDKRFDNLDEQGFPKPLPGDEKLAENDRVVSADQLDCSYHAEVTGSLQELSTWKLMAESGEMTEEAMRQCSMMPWMEYEVQGKLDFQGLEEARDLLRGPQARRLEAGIDKMLTSQGPSLEKRKARNLRRIERMKQSAVQVEQSLNEMRAMEEEGYEASQIGLKLIVPHQGKKVSLRSLSRRRLTMKQKTQQKMKQKVSKQLEAAKAKAQKKNADEAAEAEETWQHQCLQKTFKVVREFEGGQKAHGFEGLCVHAALSEANEKRLTLFCSDDKGHPLRQSVLLEFCSEVKEPVMLHLFILFFASLFVICFYVFFCICLICFYMTFCIF